MSGMTVSGGKAVTAGLTSPGGGGLLASKQVVLDSMVFTNNEATGNDFGNGGGAIHMRSDGILTVRNSTISGNKAGATGGGIYFYFDGSLTVQNSTISGNTTTDATDGKGGAGVYLFGGSMQATLQNTTISGNTSANSGGGVMLVAGPAATFENCTIVGNSAASATDTFGGGGIASFFTGLPVNITSTVVAGNTNSKAPDILNAGTTNVNFSAVGKSAGFTLTGANNIPFDTDLKLGSLADNGGPTQTITPLTGSPLIGAGSNPSNLTTDQRGPTFVRVFGSQADIGASRSSRRRSSPSPPPPSARPTPPP